MWCITTRQEAVSRNSPRTNDLIHIYNLRVVAVLKITHLLVSLSVHKSHHYDAHPHYAGAQYSDYTDAYYNGQYY